MVDTVRNRMAMIAGLSPVLADREYVFCSPPDTALGDRAAAKAIGWFKEVEGISLILEVSDARTLGLDCSAPMRRITLNVFSALDGVGLTAAVASALAKAGIPCNVVAAFHHDHVFVPTSTAARALDALTALQAEAKGDLAP